MMNDNIQKKVNVGHGLKFHIIAAVIVFLLDALFLGQGVIAGLVALFFLCSGIFKIIFLAIKKQPIVKVQFIKMGIYFVCFTIMVNNKIARVHANNVVVAVKQFKIKYNHYPRNLEVLVPEFIPVVPIVKYCASFNKFRYWKNNDNPTIENATLMYVVFPPFGRALYDFAEDRWSSID